MDSKRIDKGLLLIGVLLILISSYQLFFQRTLGEGESQVGTLAATSAVVKTKNALALDWRDAFMGSMVAENQLIYTDQRSSAEVLFDSGAELLISENSLVRITTRKASQGIDLNKGRVTAKLQGEKPLSVDVNGIEYLLSSSNNADIQLNLEEGKGEIGVLSGEVNVESQGKSESLTSDSMLLIEGDTAKKVQIAYELESPARGEVLSTLGDSAEVRFHWKPAEKAILEVTSRSGTLTQEISSGSSLKLFPGSYRWRVSSTEGNSLSSNFSVLREVPPKKLRPLEGEKLDLPMEGQTASLLLQWQGDGGEYEVEWLQKDVVQKMIVKGEGLTIPVTTGGSLSWRVKVHNEQRPLAQWSQWDQIELQVHSPPRMPVKLFPHQVEFQLYKAEAADVSLSWDSEWVEREMVFPDGTSELKTINGRSEDLQIQKAGAYKWRVRSLDQFGRSSEWSQWNTFEVMDLSGEVSREGIQRIQLQRPDQEVKFEWEGVPGTTTIFELATDRSFKNIKERREVQGESTRVMVGKTGSYFWRSRQFLPDGTINVGEPKRVIIEPVAAPKKPEKLPDLKVPLEWKSIEQRSSLWILELVISSAYADEMTGVVKINLRDHENAKSYVLRIFRTDEERPLVEKEISSPEFTWIGAATGSYKWQYAVIDHWDRRSPFSDPADLIVLPAGPAKPLLLRPIRAQEVHNNDIRFEWTKADRATQYSFQVAKEKDFKDLLIERRSSDLNQRVETLPTESGLHYWRVIAKDKEGKARQSSIGRFTLIPVKDESKREEAPAIPVWQKSFRSRAQLSWAPSQDTYSFKDSGKSGEISGTAMMALKLSGVLFLERWVVGAEILRQSGVVFEKEDYLFQKLSIDGAWKISFGSHLFSVGPRLSQLSGQEYAIENDQVKGSSASSLGYGLVAYGFHPFSSEWEAESKLAYTAGDISELEISGNLLRHFNGFYGVAGAGYLGRSYSAASGEQTSLQLNLGVGKEF